MEIWSSVGWTQVEEVHEGLFPMKGTVRSPSPEVEGTAGSMCDELTATPVPYTPVLLGGGN